VLTKRWSQSAKAHGAFASGSAFRCVEDMKRNDETRKAYKELYREIEEILFRHDLAGIAFEENKDEYDLEVGTILPRLKKAESETDVQDIVFDVFTNWFGNETIPDRNDNCDFSRYRTHPFSHQLTQGAHPLLSF
jgi:hypothetical protein